MVGGQLIGLIPFVFLLLAFVANWNTIKKKKLDLTAGQIVSVIIAYIAAIGSAFLIIYFAGPVVVNMLGAESIVAVTLIEFIFALIVIAVLSALLSVVTNRITHDSR